MADARSDLSAVGAASVASEKFMKRLEELGISEFSSRA